MGIYPVIMCGGSGTRLWPMSRRDLPKQFAIAYDGKTLFEKAYERGKSLTSSDAIVICHEDYRFLIRDVIGEGCPGAALLLEPIARNTAAAIGSAALYLISKDAEAVLACMPADHEIGSIEELKLSISEAARRAAEGWIVVLGVVPDYAATSYGYILPGMPLSERAWTVDKFVEKPTEAVAAEYCQKGYRWNSGLVVARADVLVQALTEQVPEILAACRRAIEKAKTVGTDLFLDKEALHECPSTSFDYAVLERHRRVAVVNLNSKWSDVGSWPELAKMYAADRQLNRTVGRAELKGCENTFVHSQERLTVGLGLRDVVVIDTADALLVADKGKIGELRDVVAALADAKREEAISHRLVKRPWGSFLSIDRGKEHQVKRITVKPGGVLSLQYHHHRAEHWVVVQGTARVTCDGRVFDLKQNESTYIPRGAVHRLENFGSEQLEIIEVQSGNYLGEDDIVRLSDDYGRAGEELER